MTCAPRQSPSTGSPSAIAQRVSWRGALTQDEVLEEYRAAGFPDDGWVPDGV